MVTPTIQTTHHTFKRRNLPSKAAGFSGDFYVLSRFWRKAKISSGDACWLWTASRNGKYGQFGISAGNIILAHRFAWVVSNGPVPDDLFVCHTCDVQLCVNPAHLFLGTHEDNMADMRFKGRSLRGVRATSVILNDDLVRKIRSEYKPVYGMQTKLSRKYGVIPQTIYDIVNYKTWKHVT